MAPMSRPKKEIVGKNKLKKRTDFKTALRVGDTVMVVTGGNEKRGRILKGRTGKILRFLPKKGRVVVEGLNMIKRHKRKTSAADSGGIIEREAGVAISNVMYYSEELKKPVRLKYMALEDGRKVRAFYDKTSGKYVQIEAK